MGDDDGPDRGDLALQVSLAAFIVFSIFDYLYAGTTFYSALFFLTTLLGVMLMLRGTLDYFLAGNLNTFWAGLAILMILILFFNGLGQVMSVFDLVLGLAGKVVAGVAAF